MRHNCSHFVRTRRVKFLSQNIENRELDGNNTGVDPQNIFVDLSKNKLWMSRE